MEKLDSQMYVRCSNGDRRRVMELSEKLFISQASVARCAFKKGLDIVAERGISFESAESVQREEPRT